MNIETMNLAAGLIPGGHELAPGDDADDREVDQQIDDRDEDDADQDRARDHPRRILDLVADVADVVVAEIIVDADSRRRARGRSETRARS